MASQSNTPTNHTNEDLLDETLSACMDGQVDRHGKRFAVKRLCDDQQTRQRWARYHLARAVIQQEPMIGGDVSERVKQATQALPTPVASKPAAAFLKPVAGGVIAASVAVLAVLGINQTATESMGSNEEANVGFVSQSTPMDRMFAQPATPASFGQSGATENRQRLDRLLIQHQQAARGAGVGNYWPVVSIAPAANHSNQNRAENAPENQ